MFGASMLASAIVGISPTGVSLVGTWANAILGVGPTSALLAGASPTAADFGPSRLILCVSMAGP
jgi:hypothetical protein